MPANVETMMYTNEVPWHGLGTYVGDTPLLSEDAIVAAGLDWQVEKAPAFAVLEDGLDEIEIPSEDFFFNVRTSDQKILGCVQNRYVVLQNNQAFEFMDHLVGPKNFVHYHTAGSLQGGKHIWLLAEVTGLTIEPVPGDITQPYVLLVNGHDGRMPLKALFTSVRVVCQNTLNLALGSAKKGITIRHTGDMMSKVQAAQKVLGFAKEEFETYENVAKELTKKKFDDKAFEGFLAELFPVKEGEKEGGNTRTLNIRESITELFEAGPGTDIPGVNGTAWGALQAVTNFTAHHRTTRGAGDDKQKKREKRLESVWFGSGSSLNSRALDMLVSA